MSFSLLPKYVASEASDISPDFLRSKGVKLLLLDFDNTLLPYTTNEPASKIIAWLQELKNADILLCVVSNSRKDRVKTVCARLDIPCVTNAVKPFPKGVKAAMERFSVVPEECAMIGDQIFTDTVAANGCGVTSILVKSIHNHKFWLKARHVLEVPFIYLARKRRISQ